MSATEGPDGDRPNRIPWPPLLYASTLIATWVLSRISPWPLLAEDSPWRSVGWVVLTVGIAIAVAALVRFRGLGTAVDPTGRASRLATDGIYAWTRNPMYLGGVLASLGLAFGLGSTWLLLLTPVLAVLLNVLAIRREEAYLERRFGEEYRRYRGRVRRWV